MEQGLRQRKIFFCVNPQAGGGKAAAWWRQALPALQGQGLDFFWEYSEGGPKTSQQVRQAVLHGGATAVIGIGGDGHVHDILNGLVENDALLVPKLAFGLFPAGSGCDFARMVYVRKGDTTANGLLDLLLNGYVRPVDIGKAAYLDVAGQPKSSYFLNACDIGLGAQTCMYVNARGGMMKTIIRDGKLAFLLAALQALLRYDYPRITVEADDEIFTGSYLIAAAGNGRYMGGNMCLFPHAAIDDGKFDLLLVPGFSRLKALTLMHKVYGGDILSVPGLIYRQVQSISILSEQTQELELDGELPGLAPLSVRLLPGLLPLLCFDSQNS